LDAIIPKDGFYERDGTVSIRREETVVAAGNGVSLKLEANLNHIERSYAKARDGRVRKMSVSLLSQRGLPRDQSCHSTGNEDLQVRALDTVISTEACELGS
jgi:hypothetical protein